MKVKIIKCKIPQYWYSNSIGEMYYVKPTIKYNYYREAMYEVINVAGSRHILVQDCESLFISLMREKIRGKNLYEG